ncbi:ABC-type transport auxiliary lipoprotein family protein [Falsiroseomonas sp. CW058]|uniref:ABC-type transport auxiliary lipoprotein family protein n=1 Tax=Falsiroseomonas sp. CW058 TaxID=3388664 RepID=UPI003D31A820
MTARRLLLALPPLLLGACGGIFPDRPNVPVRRFPLAPRRPSADAPRPGAPVLLLRRIRAIPGLQELGLRRQRADGAFDILPYEEWIAPPADLAEAALRGWLGASGLFAAVVAPGSRAEASLVLEAQLTVLEAAPAAGEARAALAGVLLREERLSSRVLRPFEVAGSAPLAPAADAPAMALAMGAALGQAFGRLEATLAGLGGAAVAAR